MENKHFEMEKTCEYCGNTFVARKENTRFCSQRCQKRAMCIKKQNEMEELDYEESECDSREQRPADMYGTEDYVGVLGGLFGVHRQGSQQEQMLNSLLAVQKSQIESSQTIALLKMQMDSLSKEVISLRSENEKLRTSESKLRAENERLSREFDEITVENAKLAEMTEQSNDKTAQLGSIAGTVLTQTLMGLLPHTKVGKLMGFGSGEEATLQVSNEASAEPITPQVRVTPVVESDYEVEAV